MRDNCDIAVIGGGFSGLAVLANIVRQAAPLPGNKPLSITVFSRDFSEEQEPEGFGPAYSTPRPEHLLNVRAAAMGLFADNIGGFLDWARAQSPGVAGDDYLPRRLYGRYLAAVLAETRALAQKKSIALRFSRAEVEDIVEAEKTFHIVTGGTGDPAAARYIVLAIGNALKSRAEDDARGRLILDPWAFDYASLKTRGDEIRHVALIGSGLTALDTLVSLLGSGWQGRITCFSRGALLPAGHLDAYDPAKVPTLEPGAFTGKRLSALLRQLRTTAKSAAAWQYAIDALRPFTQSLWKSLSAEDRRRLAGKYFSLWNIHRHRCAGEIRRMADAALRSGQLRMVKARCRSTRALDKGVELELQSPGRSRREAFDLAFSCAGVNYATANNPLLSRLLTRGLLESAGNPWGVKVAEDYSGYKGAAGALYALGAPLFGQLFETTAVPELRAEASVIAASLTASLSAPSRSHAAGPDGSPDAPPKANATGAP